MQILNYLNDTTYLDSIFVQQKKCETTNLRILNYGIYSPRNHPVADECRGLVVDDQKIVARAFKRFYNLGEVDINFDWGNCQVQEKLDGSIILIYWYDGWKINTRNTFGDGQTGELNKVFRDLVLEQVSLEYIDHNFDKDTTIVCELVGPHNKVVREYEPGLYLLATFKNNQEVSPPQNLNFKYPKIYNCSSLKCVSTLIETFEKDDPTFEGFVCKSGDQRIKVKSKTYLDLHRIKCNGHIASIKSFVDLYVRGETDEIIATFPEYKDRFNKMRDIIKEYQESIEIEYDLISGISDQRDFAKEAMKHQFYGVLFNARKNNTSISVALTQFDKQLVELLKARLD